MNTNHIFQCTDRYELEAHGALRGIVELPAQEGRVGVRYGGFYLMGKPENPFIYLIEFYENETCLEVVALDQVHPKYTKEAL
jgi:hypothetical protein